METMSENHVLRLTVSPVESHSFEMEVGGIVAKVTEHPTDDTRGFGWFENGQRFPWGRYTVVVPEEGFSLLAFTKAWYERTRSWLSFVHVHPDNDKLDDHDQNRWRVIHNEAVSAGTICLKRDF